MRVSVSLNSREMVVEACITSFSFSYPASVWSQRNCVTVRNKHHELLAHFQLHLFTCCQTTDGVCIHSFTTAVGDNNRTSSGLQIPDHSK
jgi:hypothetical protein